MSKHHEHFELSLSHLAQKNNVDVPCIRLRSRSSPAQRTTTRANNLGFSGTDSAATQGF
jgi:hypothetical protein